MHVVRVTPAIVRNEDEAMERVSNSVVYPHMRRECAMPSLIQRITVSVHVPSVHNGIISREVTRPMDIGWRTPQVCTRQKRGVRDFPTHHRGSRRPTKPRALQAK